MQYLHIYSCTSYTCTPYTRDTSYIVVKFQYCHEPLPGRCQTNTSDGKKIIMGIEPTKI